MVLPRRYASAIIGRYSGSCPVTKNVALAPYLSRMSRTFSVLAEGPSSNVR